MAAQRHDTVLGDKVGNSRKLAAVVDCVTEKPLHLAVIHGQVTGVDDTLQEKVGLLQLVIEEDVVLGELERTEIILFYHLSPEHIHPGEQPASAAGLLVGYTLGRDLIGEIEIIPGLYALTDSKLVDIIG